MIEKFALYILILQFVHSIEELMMGFHKIWYLFSMPFWFFLLFEVAHNIFWSLVILTDLIPYKSQLSAFFIALMFANGVQHLVWFGWKKKYVPGLLTAPAHVILFLVFFFKVLF